MEKTWNIVYWIIYKLITKAYLLFMKIDPIINIVYKTEWAKRRFDKMGKDPIKEVKFALTDKRVGQSLYWADLIILAACVIFLFGIETFYLALFNEKQLPDIGIYILVLVINVAIAYWFNHMLLFRKDKYIKYFRQFEKQPHKWKVKWTWISAGIILFPLLVLIASFIAMDVTVDFTPH